ncbi:MAG: hypothetical protein NE327_19530, partial [Lentisphaeraceae bacterium]|nr:hypothetical protein [Lentisphaeraceae bacterium]
MYNLPCLLFLLALFLIPSKAISVEQNSAKSAKAEQAAKSLQKQPGFEIGVFASHPVFGNPVAIDVDKFGRVLVAEQYRFNQGTQENRTSSFFLDDDLQVFTLDDRLKMYEKWQHKFKGGMNFFTSVPDKVRIIEDTNGDGIADKYSVMAEFKETLDGLNSGVMEINGDVWVTCIPHLWKLRDNDGDGKAEIKEKIHTGFGVRASFLGHDLHGLALGQDGRLYFSLGDRGYHVKTKEGKILAQPDNGAVFRCDLDGSNLEDIHIGLRNPQEIAFDEYGNLFAGDNNCDKGDKSRLVYIIDGGDSGWRMNYQSMMSPANGGIWMKEELWKVDSPLFNESCVPAVGYIGSGPSGLAYSSVGAWPEKWRNRFYHMNYSGGSGIISFKTVPEGASFKITEYHNFLTTSLFTDAAFGYDGKLYISHYNANPWSLGEDGHIYTLTSSETAAQEKNELAKLAKSDFSKFTSQKLFSLLSHKDMRLRLRAQLELAKSTENIEPFTKLAANENADLLARLHSVWGLWNLGLKGKTVFPSLHSLAQNKTTEIRKQAVKVLADLSDKSFEKGFLKALNDSDLQTVSFAAQGLGRIKSEKAIVPLMNLIRKNAGKDAHIKHACVIALSRIQDKSSLAKFFKDESEHVRMAAVLILRKWQDPRLSEFLNDANDKVVLEAARAIYESEVESAYKDLAKVSSRSEKAQQPFKDAIQRRVMNVNRRLAGKENFKNILAFFNNSSNSSHIRKIAFDFLIDWNKTVNRDLTTGRWWPQSPGSKSEAQEQLKEISDDFISEKTKENWQHFFLLAKEFSVTIPNDITAFALKHGDDSSKIAILNYQQLHSADSAAGTALSFIESKSSKLRSAALNYINTADPQKALKMYEELLSKNDIPCNIKQTCLANLSKMKNDQSRALILNSLKKLDEGSLNKDIAFDVLEAARANKDNQGIAELLNHIESKVKSS